MNVDPEKLKAYGLSTEKVALALASGNTVQPSGNADIGTIHTHFCCGERSAAWCCSGGGISVERVVELTVSNRIQQTNASWRLPASLA
jgi:multidrug efflux pump subunit AcrB